MLTFRSLQTPLAAAAEHSLDALLREGIHAWMTGADSESTIRGAKQTRSELGSPPPGCVVTRDDRVLAVGRAARADWDSRHFGREVCRLDHIALARSADPAERDAAAIVLASGLVDAVPASALVLARVALDDVPVIRALEQAEFRTFDVQTTWMGRGVVDAPLAANGVRLRAGRPEDGDVLARLCADAMRVTPSHLNADPTLDPARVYALYAEWARNSVCAGLADHVVVAEADGAIAAFASVRLIAGFGPGKGCVGAIPLVAVDANHRGRGMGRAVVGAALAWLRQRDALTATIGTQSSNLPAARLYASLGLVQSQTVVNLHRAGLADR